MLYTIKQSQFKGGLTSNTHWVTVWSGNAKDEKDARRKAAAEIAKKLLVTPEE